jgi:histidine ammonia-lyase
MTTTLPFGTEHLSIEHLQILLKNKIHLTDEAIAKINKCRAYLDAKMEVPNAIYYGINTGFGSLCNVAISKKDLSQLQENLVLSHACGLGEMVPVEIVKIILLLKIKNFVYGNSGVSLQVVQRLVDMYNNDVLPVIYSQGSLGASGDLAPLAHLSLPLLGKGQVYFNGNIVASDVAMNQFDWEPIKLQSKEGLALLNGTQFMSGYGIASLIKMKNLQQWAIHIAAISIDAWQCVASPFDSLVHQVRNQNGQQKVAAQILEILKGSQMMSLPKKQVQDPYSFRCIPQVHGATYDTIEQFEKIFTNEINAVTDNPLVFPDEDKIISGGNFHGQPLAIQLDFAAIAVAEIASISERRTYLLISGQRELPPYLIQDAGLASGLMIPQYTAASIVSQNKQLCTPASIDSIMSSNGQEDHVSMGANAATKLWQVVLNVEKVLAIELLNATQALEFRRPHLTAPILETLVKNYREKVPFIIKDKLLSVEMLKSIEFIRNYNLG